MENIYKIIVAALVVLFSIVAGALLLNNDAPADPLMPGTIAADSMPSSTHYVENITSNGVVASWTIDGFDGSFVIKPDDNDDLRVYAIHQDKFGVWREDVMLE